MENFKLSNDIFERYMDISVELFMECYAEIFPDGSDADIQEKGSPRLKERFNALIKANRRRQKRKDFVKGCGKVLKAAAAVVVMFLSLGSFLFITVEAVREPIMSFYIKQNEGYMELSNTPFVPVESFNEQDPLGAILPDDFYIQSVDGDLSSSLVVVYRNEDDYVIFNCMDPEGDVTINTEDCEVVHFQVSGYDAIFTVENDVPVYMLLWHNTDLDKFFVIQTNCYNQDQLVDLAEMVNYMLSY